MIRRAVLPTLLALAVLGPPRLPAGEIETEEVAYRTSTVRAKSYLAKPVGEGPYPGVLVLPEWWGLNEFTRKRADLLAEAGFVALAVDLFGGGQQAHQPQQAAQFAAAVVNNQPELAARFKASMKYLQARPETDPKKVAAVGYGFLGGDVALQMARNGTVGLDGVVAFHPRMELRAPNPPVEKLTAKLLVLHAGEDPFIHLVKEDAVDVFRAQMKALNADLKFVLYPKAMRSFYNPQASLLGEKFNIPMVYDLNSDHASRKELLTFLKDLWKK